MSDWFPEELKDWFAEKELKHLNATAGPSLTTGTIIARQREAACRSKIPKVWLVGKTDAQMCVRFTKMRDTKSRIPTCCEGMTCVMTNQVCLPYALLTGSVVLVSLRPEIPKHFVTVVLPFGGRRVAIPWQCGRNLSACISRAACVRQGVSLVYMHPTADRLHRLVRWFMS